MFSIGWCCCTDLCCNTYDCTLQCGSSTPPAGSVGGPTMGPSASSPTTPHHHRGFQTVHDIHVGATLPSIHARSLIIVGYVIADFGTRGQIWPDPPSLRSSTLVAFIRPRRFIVGAWPYSSVGSGRSSSALDRVHPQDLASSSSAHGRVAAFIRQIWPIHRWWLAGSVLAASIHPLRAHPTSPRSPRSSNLGRNFDYQYQGQIIFFRNNCTFKILIINTKANS